MIRTTVIRRTLIWIAAAVGGFLGILLLMHAFISPINPEQDTPKVHIDAACWACHVVSDSVDVQDLEEEGS